MVILFISTLELIHNLLSQLKTLTKLVDGLWSHVKFMTPSLDSLALGLQVRQLLLIFWLVRELSVLVKPVLSILQLEAVFISVFLQHKFLQFLTKLSTNIVDIFLDTILGCQSLSLRLILIVHCVLFQNRILKPLRTKLSISSLTDGEINCLVDHLLSLHHLHFLLLLWFGFTSLHFLIRLGLNWSFTTLGFSFFIFLFLLFTDSFLFLLISFHLLRNLFLNFVFLHQIGRTDSKDTIWIDSDLHFDFLASSLCCWSHISNFKYSDVSFWIWNIVYIFSSDLKSTCFVECEHLAEGDRMILREYLHLAGGRLALAGCVLGPDQLDGVGLDVGHAELPDLEHGREDGALEGAASRHGLVSVQRSARLLPEHTLNDGFDGRNASTSSNYFNTVNFLWFQL